MQNVWLIYEVRHTETTSRCHSWKCGDYGHISKKHLPQDYGSGHQSFSQTEIDILMDLIPVKQDAEGRHDVPHKTIVTEVW